MCRGCAAGSHLPIPPSYAVKITGSNTAARPAPRPQGSTDGTTWVDLRRHIDDRRLRMPGQYASWPVVGHASSVPYRLFRVLLIGPNPEAQNPRHVCLSYLELYGYFYREEGC